MENAGYYCGIYASDVSGFVERLDLSRLSKFDKWVANYIGKPSCVASYGIWQKSSTGKIDGIKADVDLDEAYKDYPAIIKNAGLNGFKKPENPAPTQEKPAPQTGELSLNGKKYKVTFEEI
jgi:GH25 family lysozyme M1 (1,4-beta-N-acetylmuramidase)